MIGPGNVVPGDPVSYRPAPAPSLGIVEFGEMLYARELSREQLERALAAPICERERSMHEDQPAALDAASP